MVVQSVLFYIFPAERPGRNDLPINMIENVSDLSALQHAKAVNLDFSFFNPCVGSLHKLQLEGIR